MKNLFLLGFVFFMIGCTSGGGNPACEWQTFEPLGKITAIKPITKNGKNLLSVEMKFNSSSLKNETQYLEQLQNIEIDSAFIARNKMKVGLKYKFTVHEVISGNCESPIVTFHHTLK